MRIVKSAIPDNIQVTKEAVPLRIVASDVASFGAGFPGKVNKEALEALKKIKSPSDGWTWWCSVAVVVGGRGR